MHTKLPLIGLLLIGLSLSAFIACGTAQAQRLNAFGEPHFKGKETVFRDPQTNLQAEGPTKIASVQIVAGRWLLCAGSGFSGDCAWVSGEVESLPAFGFTDEPGSLRPEPVPVMMRNWGDRRPAPRQDLVLFEKTGFDGEWKALKDSVADFGAAKLASPGSVVLAEGVWRLCTAPNYQGRCLLMTGSAWNFGEIFPGRILSAKRLK